MKQEKNVSLRLCQAFLPIIKRFTKLEEDDQVSAETEEIKGQPLLQETPKTPEELISLLEKIQKNVQANDFFKKIFE